MESIPLAEFQGRAGEASKLLRAVANEQRLLILCHLIGAAEMSVSALAAELELSQSALSQHLARLREEGIVSFRREAQALFYRVDDDKTLRILMLLKDIFCPEPLIPNGEEK